MSGHHLCFSCSPHFSLLQEKSFVSKIHYDFFWEKKWGYGEGVEMVFTMDFLPQKATFQPSLGNTFTRQLHTHKRIVITNTRETEKSAFKLLQIQEYVNKSWMNPECTQHSMLHFFWSVWAQKQVWHRGTLVLYNMKYNFFVGCFFFCQRSSEIFFLPICILSSLRVDLITVTN